MSSDRSTDRRRSDEHLAGASELLDEALKHLGVPFRWAGEDPHGFDCSGFVHFVFDRIGEALPRTAQEQSFVGSWVALDEVLPGDLVFFGERRSDLHHVGIVTSRPGQPLQMIHASSSRGVIRTEVTRNRYWVKRLKLARRVLRR